MAAAVTFLEPMAPLDAQGLTGAAPAGLANGIKGIVSPSLVGVSGRRGRQIVAVRFCAPRAAMGSFAGGEAVPAPVMRTSYGTRYPRT